MRQLNVDVEKVLPYRIFTMERCIFCVRAKMLMNKHGIEYNEKHLQGDSLERCILCEPGSYAICSPEAFVLPLDKSSSVLSLSETDENLTFDSADDCTLKMVSGIIGS